MATYYERPPGSDCPSPSEQAPPQVSPSLFKHYSSKSQARLPLRLWFQANTSPPQWLPSPWRHPLLGYLLALLLEVLVAGLTLVTVHHLPVFALQGTLITLGVVVVALAWGSGPGFFAALAGTALLEFLVLPAYVPGFLTTASAGFCIAMFLLVSLCISLIAGQSRLARSQAEEMVTSLREAHTRAEQEHLRLRTLLDALPAAVGMLDAQSRLLEMNPANKALWGEDAPHPGEVVQTHTWRGWWPDTGKPLSPDEWAITRALTRGETTINQEVEVEISGGQHKLILDSAVPIRDARGVILGGAGIHQDITERKQLEEALRASERQAAAHARELEVIFEAVTDGMLVYDHEGRILRHNTAARQILGFDTRPDVLSLPFRERAHYYGSLDEQGQPFPTEQLALSRVLRGEVLTSSHATDERPHTLDGRELAVNITGAPLRDADGAITGAVAIVRDVTRRRQLEQEVVERAAQLEAIFESITDGLIVADCQGRVLQMNQAIKTLLGIEYDPRGFTMPQLEAMTAFEPRTAQGQPLTPEARPITRYLRGEVLTRQQSVDLIVQTRDGRVVQVNTGGAPIRDAAGHIIGAVEVIRDVTEQRRLEQHTHETLNALLLMAEALVQTPYQTPDLPADTAPHVDQVAQRLAELTRSVLGCQRVSMAAIEPTTGTLTPVTAVGLSSESEQQWWEGWSLSPDGGMGLQPAAFAALCEGQPVLLEGTLSPLPVWKCVAPEHQALLVPMRVGETLVGVLRVECGMVGEHYTGPNKQALVRAVARLGALVLERERLLREREEARASELALRETNMQMDTFLGMAGHELKTPMTSLKLALQLTGRRLRRPLWRETGASANLAPVLEQVALGVRQADRLDRLVNDLLDVSRIRAGKLELHLERADLASIVSEAVQEQQQAAPGRIISLQLPNKQPFPVAADTDRIGQVITNYLTNALKYSSADLPVEVGLIANGQQARVWVRDQGPGLPVEEQERIWERFHRAKGIEAQSGNGVGLGLGLYICRMIIERHQGQVGVESVPGQGSTFWFSLPLTR
ncbi:MAG TPA: PAS domain S-box protein [Ktedonobacterales bacterium]